MIHAIDNCFAVYNFKDKWYSDFFAWDEFVHCCVRHLLFVLSQMTVLYLDGRQSINLVVERVSQVYCWRVLTWLSIYDVRTCVIFSVVPRDFTFIHHCQHVCYLYCLNVFGVLMLNDY